jgi:uroporphyrinogen-III synthase
VDHLAGWTIAVTAERRAAEQADLLQRRGAEVVLAPLVASTAVADAEVRAATLALLQGPLDTLVVSSGVGVRAWMAMAWTWGLGERLTAALQATDVWARGTKAAGALVSEGIDVAWRAPSETLSETLDELLTSGVTGRRIGVQLHGGDMAWFVAALVDAGAIVATVPIYRVGQPPSDRAADRLTVAARRGELDALTLTSSMAVAELATVAGLVDDLHRHAVVCACVGPLTAAAARDAGLPHVVEAEPHRLGSMVRVLGERMASHGRTFDVAGVVVRLQGARLDVDGSEIRLTPRERRLLEAMLANPGAVLSKDQLAATAWDTSVDAHTVEVTVNRLRRKLGPAAAALETTNRRGYRIAV